MWSWTVEAHADSTASPAHVWDLWSDVRNWPMWDNNLAESRLESHFSPGVAGKLCSKRGTTIRFVLSDVVLGRHFSVLARLPFAKIHFSHDLDVLPEGGVRIRHAARAEGIFAPLLRWTMRPAIRRGLYQSVEAVAGLAEERSYTG